MKTLVLAVAIAAALSIATAARAATVGQQIDLNAAVGRFAGRPITFQIAPELPGSWSGGAFPGIPWIILGRDAWNDAEVGGGHGLMVLLHEVGHTTGIDNEGEANCFALAHLIPFMQANWQMPDAWMHVEAKAYAEARASMLQQSAVYQCHR